MRFFEEDEDGLNNPIQNDEFESSDTTRNISFERNVSKQARRKAQKKLKEKAVKKAAVKGKFAAALGPIIFWAVVIFIIATVIVGIIMFLITMPGMVMEKIKAIGKNLAKGLASWFGADTTKMIEDEVIYNTLDYLETMNYDLKGYGFLTNYMTESDVSNLKSDEKKNGAQLDQDTGVIRDDDGKIVKAASDFLMAYQISDNYVYTVKNENLVTDSGFKGKLQALGRHFVDFFGGSLGKNWTRGMIAFYNESGGFGKKGSLYSDSGLFNFDDLKFDVNTRTLTIEKSSLFNSNKPMVYNLDGWIGRYGMPIDFLLSVHVATMMPDLAYDMANTFETEIAILFHPVTGAQIEAGFYNGQKHITRDEIYDSINWQLVDLRTTLSIMNTFSIQSPDSCENFIASGVRCSDSGFAETTSCFTCMYYIENILYELECATDPNFSYYIPYIANVTEHWYRDVHFVNSGKEFVKYDYDYEAMMKERWTLYEVDDKNKYKLYVVDSNTGEYATDVSQYSGNTKIEPDNKFTNLYVYKGTSEEANDEGVAVSKKPVTLTVSNTNELTDIGWEKASNGVWSAYALTNKETTSSWEQEYPEDSDFIRNRVYTRIVSNVEIKQKGEGQRTETNSDIKKMFLSNTYFRYDGNVENAEIITKLRNSIKNDVTANTIVYGNLDELKDKNGNKILEKSYTYTESDGKGGTKEVTYKVADYSGQVTLNQDSLNAFSMLENTHTLDSDYIYRDFKELVVELGYFEKEELTDETPKLLQWIVPKTGSYGYPDRTIDKRENEMGSMIHSKGDITANMQNTLEAVLNEDDSSLSEGDAQESETQTSSEPEVTPTPPVIPEPESSASLIMPESSSLALESNMGTSINENVEESNIIDETELDDNSESSSSVEDIANLISKLDNHESVLKSLNTQYGTLLQIDESASGDGYSSATVYNGVTYLNYKQGSGSYSGLPFWNGTYASSACGPTSAAILASGYGCKEGPKYFGDIIKSNTTFEKIKKTLETVGIEGTWKTFSKTDSATQECLQMAEEALAAGKPVIMLTGKTKGSSHQYTSSGHFLVVVGIEDDGKLIISNPASYAKYYTGNGSFNPKSTLLEDFIHNYITVDSIKSSRGIYIPDEAPNGITTAQPYVGYSGNEEVVSPVTGILLDYGTYTDQDINSVTQNQYRVNVDLKYGPLIVDEDTSASGTGTTKKEFESKIVSDKVGYAKILVLDTEHYLKLEQSTNNSWDSPGTSLVQNGVYQEKLVSDSSQTAQEKLKEMAEIDKTIYGYKEFAEMYTKYGIAGYVIYIDGFICELPDKDLANDKKVAQKIPNGDSIDMEYFEEVDENDIKNKKEKLKSMYKKSQRYKVMSTKATEKLNAENEVKSQASSSIYADNLIFIKEGTVIGRTMTDRELVEKMRNNTCGTFKENRPSAFGGKKTDDKVIGNYLRIIMRDLDDTPVENVEDYMKLDESMRRDDDYDVSDPSLFVTLDEFLRMFADRPNIIANAQAFIDIQDKYGVNAVFAACVTITESGGGTGWDLIDPSTYNWFSIKGSYNGSSYIDRKGTSWKRYPSFAAAVDDFGNLIANSRHYFQNDKFWVSEIGPTYCNAKWSQTVISLMTKAYEKI